MPAGSFPPIRPMEDFPAISVTPTGSLQWVFDFGQNMAGFVTLHVSQTGLPANAVVKLEHAEIVSGSGSLTNTFCNPNPAHPSLRLEPCAPHQTYGDGHLIADRYIGDFNDANMTNLYTVSGPDDPDYTPLFAGLN
jgi:hypothetical protein